MTIFRAPALAALLALAGVPADTAAKAVSSQEATASSSYALLGPQFGRGVIDDRLKDAIVDRAHKLLDRDPAPAKHIRIEGVSSGQTQAPGVAVKSAETADSIARSRTSLEDMEAMLDLALAWRVTGEKPFLRKACQYIEAWVSTYELSFNPVDEGRFDNLILAYDLVETRAPKALRGKADAFMRRMAAGYIEAMETGNVPIKPTLTNNWQSHRIKLATLAAYQLGDDQLIARSHDLFNKQVDANLRGDGTTVDFLQRDALHYVTYSLGSQLTAAAAAQAHGQDWYSHKGPAGQSLSRTLAWLGPFARGEQVHIEFLKSVVPYDRQRAAAGGKTYQNKPWNPATADQVYALAASLDPKWFELSKQLQAANESESSSGLAEDEPREWLYLLRDGK
ncbi:alginate lyase family protein [Novosphingobium sp.]|uniref:alginate lyase family protein n=1 Tax=Novosphingobium sp. TaxID=1874826 RepID=UPI002FDF7F09